MAVLGAERLLELGEQIRVLVLVAAAVAEDRADERGHGDHVVDGRRAARDRGVVRVVGVEPVGVVRHVDQHLPPLGAVGAEELLALLGHERLGLRGSA